MELEEENSQAALDLTGEEISKGSQVEASVESGAEGINQSDHGDQKPQDPEDVAESSSPRVVTGETEEGIDHTSDNAPESRNADDRETTASDEKDETNMAEESEAGLAEGSEHRPNNPEEVGVEKGNEDSVQDVDVVVENSGQEIGESPGTREPEPPSAPRPIKQQTKSHGRRLVVPESGIVVQASTNGNEDSNESVSDVPSESDMSSYAPIDVDVTINTRQYPRPGRNEFYKNLIPVDHNRGDKKIHGVSRSQFYTNKTYTPGPGQYDTHGLAPNGDYIPFDHAANLRDKVDRPWTTSSAGMRGIWNKTRPKHKFVDYRAMFFPRHEPTPGPGQYDMVILPSGADLMGRSRKQMNFPRASRAQEWKRFTTRADYKLLDMKRGQGNPGPGVVSTQQVGGFGRLQTVSNRKSAVRVAFQGLGNKSRVEVYSGGVRKFPNIHK